MSVDLQSKKYKILYEKIIEMGITDSEAIEKLIEQVDSFSNLIIDLYLKTKE